MTKKESKDKRVSEILQAAVDVFLEKGYENASMDSIAEKAGISKGGLYHHFLSKDILLLQANGKLMEPVDEIMKKAKEYKSAAEGLKYFIGEYLSFWLSRRKELVFFFLSMTKALNDNALSMLYQAFSEKYIGFYEGLYIKGIRYGEFIDHDTRGSAIALMSALDGVLGYMAFDKKLEYDQVCKAYEERFIDSLKINTLE